MLATPLMLERGKFTSWVAGTAVFVEVTNEWRIYVSSAQTTSVCAYISSIDSGNTWAAQKDIFTGLPGPHVANIVSTEVDDTRHAIVSIISDAYESTVTQVLGATDSDHYDFQFALK